MSSLFAFPARDRVVNLGHDLIDDGKIVFVVNDGGIEGIPGIDILPECDIVLDNRIEWKMCIAGGGMGVGWSARNHGEQEDEKAPEEMDDGGADC